MTTKKVFYLLVVVLLAIFVVQNIALVTVSFLFWELTLPRSVIVAITFAIGFIAGFGFFEIRQHKNDIEKQ